MLCCYVYCQYLEVILSIHRVKCTFYLYLYSILNAHTSNNNNRNWATFDISIMFWKQNCILAFQFMSTQSIQNGYIIYFHSRNSFTSSPFLIHILKIAHLHQRILVFDWCTSWRKKLSIKYKTATTKVK